MTSAAKLRAYSDHLCDLTESSLYLFYCAPRFCLRPLSSEHWNEDLKASSQDILAAAEANQKPLEINGAGIRKLAQRSGKEAHPGISLREFWEVASDYRVRVVCNSDAHQPDHAMASIKECVQYAEEPGLNYQLPATNIKSPRYQAHLVQSMTASFSSSGKIISILSRRPPIRRIPLI